MWASSIDCTSASGGDTAPSPGGAFLHARQQGPGCDPGRGASRVGVSQREDHAGIGTGVERRVPAGVEERRAAGRAVVLADHETVQDQVRDVGLGGVERVHGGQPAGAEEPPPLRILGGLLGLHLRQQRADRGRRISRDMARDVVGCSASSSAGGSCSTSTPSPSS